ncbi:MAG TPA: haloacid dehalogenase type II [Gemmatimonadaceae bacterium]|nr:haloacid dehalogenase type II [Gemmatimonadaceae bacterium]
MLDLTRFSALTFDCYGTLIDWESGLLDAFARLVAPYGITADAESLLAQFAAIEARLEAEPYQMYRSVLRSTFLEMGPRLGFSPRSTDADKFAGSVDLWPAFADSSAALKGLKTKFRLGVISNIDDDLLAYSLAKLGVSFDWVITAQQVGAYKPAPAIFHAALERVDVPRDRILHVAQSLYHDIGPANALGLPSVWVNRRSGKAGSGATLPALAKPDLVVPDLATLARLAGVSQTTG